MYVLYCYPLFLYTQFSAAGWMKNHSFVQLDLPVWTVNRENCLFENSQLDQVNPAAVIGHVHISSQYYIVYITSVLYSSTLPFQPLFDHNEIILISLL